MIIIDAIVYSSLGMIIGFSLGMIIVTLGWYVPS